VANHPQLPQLAERIDEAHHLLRRRVVGGTTLVGVSAIFAIWIGLHIGGATSVKTFDDVVTALAALTATVMCLRAGSLHTGRLRRFWLFMAAACAAWTVAETIWAVYDLVLRQAIPVPSWADLGYLSAIPLAVAALISHPSMHDKTHHRARAALDGIVVASALLFLSWSFVLGPLWRHTDLTKFGGVVALAYPFGDIVILFLVVLVMRAMKAGDRFALWCVLGGLVAMALADSTYTYLSEVGTYSTGNIVDVGWVVGYLGLALGAYGSTAEDVVVTRRSTAPSMASIVVPFVPVIIALGASTVRVALGDKLHFADWVMALALTLFVLARQALFLIDGFSPPEPPGSDDWGVPFPTGAVASAESGSLLLEEVPQT